MNKIFKPFGLIVIAAIFLTEVGCSSAASAPKEITVELNGRLSDYEDNFECADGWTNGGMFNCIWRKSNISFTGEAMKLTIDLDSEAQDQEQEQAQDIPYSGSEFRSKAFYSYGKYETVMKPIKNDGVVSSFFTYTGPSDENPWDEIDIEFLGKDTTVVQFNYFTGGKGNHEYIYKLGFDASESFHTYGFDWQPDKIIWYVDGKAVHTATRDIPSTPGKIMMNVWPGKNVDSWLKPYNGKTPLSAEYKTISYKPGK